MNSEFGRLQLQQVYSFLAGHPGAPVMLVGGSSIQLRGVAEAIITGDREWSAKKANSDFLILEPERGNIGIDKVLEARSFYSHRPVYGQRKYLLVCNSEQMTTEAANAFLKMLEEPPHYLTIVLTSTAVQRHLPTIRSRVVTFSVAYPLDSLRDLRRVYKKDARHLLAVSADNYVVLKCLLERPEEFRGLLDYMETMEEIDSDALMERLFDAAAADTVEAALIKRKAEAWLLRSFSRSNTQPFGILERLDGRMKKSGQYFDHLKSLASVTRSMLRDLLLLDITSRSSELLNIDLIEWLAGKRPLRSLEQDLLWCDQLIRMNKAVLNNRLVLHRIVSSIVKHTAKN